MNIRSLLDDVLDEAILVLYVLRVGGPLALVEWALSEIRWRL